jgi:hypothetical protein
VRLGLLALLLVPACGAAPAPTDACLVPSGSYTETLTELSGDCGPVVDAMLAAASSGGDPPCTGYLAPAATGCGQIVDLTCQPAAGPDADRLVSESGSLDWSADASAATGQIQYEVTQIQYEVRNETAEIPICSGLYQVRLAR